MSDEFIMPMQPIDDKRFVPNRIVQHLLDNGGIDLNDIAMLSFTNEERMQFAQLIGYSLGGYSELSYVSDESYDAACELSEDSSLDQKETIIQAQALRLRQIQHLVKGLSDFVGDYCDE